VAYLLTAATIIPAVESKAIVQKMREWIFYRLLIKYFGAGIAGSSILLLLSIAGRPLAGLTHQAYEIDALFSAIWWGALGYTVAAVFRIVRLFLTLLLAQ